MHRIARSLRFSPALFTLLAVTGLFLAGCESVSDRVRFARDLPPLTHDFEKSSADVLAAAPAGLLQMGFKVTRSSSAHGLIEALSDVRRDMGMRSSKQIRLRMTVVDLDGGGAKASLQLWEIREEENSRGERFATEVGVGSIALHDAVFAAIGHILNAPTE